MTVKNKKLLAALATFLIGGTTAVADDSPLGNVALESSRSIIGNDEFTKKKVGKLDGLPDMVFVSLNSRITSGIGRASSRDHGSQWRRWQLRRRQ